MIEKANVYRLNLAELNDSEDSISFKAIVMEDSVTIDRLSSWLREKINLSFEKQKDEFNRPEKLLEYVREQFYKIGIYIFKDSFQDDTVSGLCLYDGLFPVILLNNKTTFSRQLFTVFHEFYHIYLQETDVAFTNEKEEKACDNFASSFLIPEEDFVVTLGNRKNYEDDDFISQLAERYCTSRDAIRYRLLKQNKISREFYLERREDDIRKMNTTSTGGNFYYTKISYLGQPYLKKVFSQYYSGRISIATVGLFTQLKTAHVSKLASSIFGGEF